MNRQTDKSGFIGPFPTNQQVKPRSSQETQSAKAKNQTKKQQPNPKQKQFLVYVKGLLELRHLNPSSNKNIKTNKTTEILNRRKLKIFKSEENIF